MLIALLDRPPIMPTTAFHQIHDIERYRRYKQMPIFTVLHKGLSKPSCAPCPKRHTPMPCIYPFHSSHHYVTHSHKAQEVAPKSPSDGLPGPLRSLAAGGLHLTGERSIHEDRHYHTRGRCG